MNFSPMLMILPFIYSITGPNKLKIRHIVGYKKNKWYPSLRM